MPQKFVSCETTDRLLVSGAGATGSSCLVYNVAQKQYCTVCWCTLLVTTPEGYNRAEFSISLTE